MFSLNNNSKASIIGWPGGKWYGRKFIMPYIPTDKITEMCSPFFGGGNIELEVANRGIRVYGYDKFEPLAHFWRQVLRYPEAVHHEVKKMLPIEKDEIKRLKKAYGEYQGFKRAAVFFILSKTAFSGIVFKGGIKMGLG